MRFDRFPGGNVEFSKEDNWECWGTTGHMVWRCDATTGHSVSPVAFCDTAVRAAEIVTAIAKAQGAFAADTAGQGQDGKR